MDVFSAAHFRDDDAARKFLEGILWPDGPVCPHCGVIGHAYATKRPGVYRCAEKECRKDFSVTQKTVMERSHIALHRWVQAFVLMTASKKGFSAAQLSRMLDIHYQSAWFMAHRIRECMRQGGLGQLGGGGMIVEADETYYGPVQNPRTKRTDGTPYLKKGRAANKRPIVSLVERGGNVRSFHVPVCDGESVGKIVRENIARESRLHTDESSLYPDIAGKWFQRHDTVKHTAGEYVRYDDDAIVHTNSAEGFFSIFKRGMRGVYQHCKEKHLHRYLAEFDFRYNHRIALGINDGERAALAVKSAAGKRLTYRIPH